MRIDPTAKSVVCLLLVAAAFSVAGCGDDASETTALPDMAGDSDSTDTTPSDTTDTNASVDMMDATNPSPPCGANENVVAGACMPCAAGTTNDAGDDPSGADTTCDATLCGVDEFVQANACTPCAAGTSNDAGDDASGADTMCDITLCGADEFVQTNVCVPCPMGSSNMAGDDPSGADTMCDGDLCPSDQFVQGNACVACPPGTSNDAGDDASGADTMCDVVLCSPDEFVQNNACMRCAPGTTNPGGNDPTGADTACVPVLCALDEFVQNNLCTPCPAGTFNDAGDDASGADTQCNDACFQAFGISCPEFEEAYVKASNTDAGDFFGWSVALDGDTLVVGALNEESNTTGVNNDQNDNSANSSGAAYVFVRTHGMWSQQAYLKASNAEAGDDFGSRVTISGDTIAVSAPHEDSNATGVNNDETNNNASFSGAVYIFVRSGTTWTQEAYLKASNTDALDGFGASIAIDGNTLVVGADNENSSATIVNGDGNDNSAINSGAAYVFVRNGTTWTQEAYLKPSNARNNVNFGSAVDVEGDTIIVQAEGDNSNATNVNGDQFNGSISRSGAVFLFTRANGMWTQDAYIKSTNPDPFDEFGRSLAISGTTLIAGSSSEDSNATGIDGNQSDNSATGAGAVYVRKLAP